MSGAPGGDAGPASDAGTAAPAQEAPNLDYKKQAAELALKRLKEGLSRGEVDQKLLDELGWNEAQLERFVDRMSDALQNSSQTPATPVEEARRLQFEEMLKSLDLNRSSQLRKGSDQPSREVEQIDSRRTPVPVEYRKAWERYTKTLSRSPASKAPAREK
jgi:collagen type III alpha